MADAWWPMVEVAGKGVPVRHAAKEGYRARRIGQPIRASTRSLDVCHEWFNFRLGAYAGARQSQIGYFSIAGTMRIICHANCLPAQLVAEVYGGIGRSLGNRAAKVHARNTRPANLECYTEKRNEFLAA